jgi:hypothetical protein
MQNSSRTAKQPSSSRGSAISTGPTNGKSFPAQTNAAAIQRTTEIKYDPLQDFYVKGKPHKVGKGMTANLDPDDPKVGTETKNSPAIDSAMDALPSIKSTWVKGHLLNHDLGGIAFAHNLFPISTGANGEHKNEVEYTVKQWLYDGCEVYYKVDASQPSASSHNGTFDCEARVLNVKKSSGNKHALKKAKKTIHSSEKGDQDYERKHFDSKKDKEIEDRYSKVEYHSSNNSYRDEYSKNSVLKDWAHTIENQKFYDDLDKDILKKDPNNVFELIVSQAPNELAPVVKTVTKNVIQSPSLIKKPSQEKALLKEFLKLLDNLVELGKDNSTATILIITAMICLLLYKFFAS